MQNISANQVSAEVPINENFVNLLWAELFARNPVTSSGLTWGYVGGYWPINGVNTAIASGTIALSASATNYIGVTQAGAVVSQAGTANPLHCPLFVVVTGPSTVTSFTDVRTVNQLHRHSHGLAAIAMADSNQTLTQSQSVCETLAASGTLTAQRSIIVPLVRRRWAVRCTTLVFGVQVIGATGAGVVVAPGTSAFVECDGVDVFRLTANA